MLIARTVLETVAKALTDAHDVKVVFYGDRCETDGRVITLPSLPDKIPAEIISMLRGYLDHEVGHIAFTDFKTYRKLPKNETERFALNAIEDVRIELEMESIWKGCKVNFERAFDMVSEDLTTGKKKDAWEKHDAVTKVFILFIAVARYGFDVPLLVEYSPEYSPIIDELSDEIEASHELGDTEEAYEMAVRVLEKIEHIVREHSRHPLLIPKKKKTGEGDMSAEEAAGASGGGSGGGSGTGKPPKDGSKGPKDHSVATEEKGSSSGVAPGTETDEETYEMGEDIDDDIETEEGGSDDTGTDEEEVEEVEEMESETEKGEDKKSGGEAGESEDSEDKGSDEEEPAIDEEILERLRESLKDDASKVLPDVSGKIKIKTSSLRGYRVLTSEKDTFTEWPGTKLGQDEYEIFKKSCNGIVGVLKNQLNRLLMSKKRASWMGGKQHGVVNPATLHMAVQRTSNKLYRVRMEGKKINSAVSILVDLSGSMGGERMRKANETVVLMTETLHLAGIPFEILGFTGDKLVSGASGEGAHHFDRYGSLDMYYFKLFSEPLNQITKKRIGSMRAKSQNYDGESVRFAAIRLLKRPERKKVLFVLSDGEPSACHCKSSSLSPHLKQVCSELQNLQDFYLCGFGIQTDAPKRFYRNHVLVNDLKELPKVLMENLYRALI